MGQNFESLPGAGLGGTRLALDAQTPQPPQSAPKSPSAQACSSEPSGPNGALVKELVKILDETQSPDTLLVTVGLLAEMKADAKLAVPAAIRAAERQAAPCGGPSPSTQASRSP
jgi:hypothetical protein